MMFPNRLPSGWPFLARCPAAASASLRPFSGSLASASVLALLLACAPAHAQNSGPKTAQPHPDLDLNIASQPLPLPSGDFEVKARNMRGAELDLSHHTGKIRVEVARPGSDVKIIGIIEMKAGKMVMLMPNLPNMALEMDLPPQYAVTALNGTGKKLGSSEIAGESCDLWLLDDVKAGRTIACITPDGIALRTQVDIEGAMRTVYEASSITRTPQDPARFELPPGVKITRLSRETLGTLSTLPGVNNLISKGLPGQNPN